MTVIERLRAATEGSTELDLEIARAIGRDPETFTADLGGGWMAAGVEFVPRWTRRVEVAATLLPADLSWGVASYGGAASAWCSSGDDCGAATPALALCVAALMARGVKA
jgi:hypothetical protein